MPEQFHVDILCVVDGESLLRDFPSATSPANRKVFHAGSPEIQPYCRMITRDGSPKVESKDHGLRGAIDHKTVSSDLTVRARVGDVVRWRATSLTLDDEYEIEILDFIDGNSWTLYDKPDRRQSHYSGEFYWISKMNRAGSDTYWLTFKVKKNDLMDPREGYFYWDPGLVILDK